MQENCFCCGQAGRVHLKLSLFLEAASKAVNCDPYTV